MSSLFGGSSTPATNANAGKSLFDRTSAPTTTQPASTNSLFSRITLPTASSTPSLFGASTATTSAPATSSLFGSATTSNTAATQPATTAPSLFGATPATTAAAPSLFGAAATTKPATPSLFGATNTTQAASTGGGLFGAMTSTAKPAMTGGLFGSTATPAAQPAASQAVAAQPQEIAFAANPSYFDQLLERGKKRQTEEHATPYGDLPALELGLADISRKVRNLGQGGPSAGLAKNGDLTKAHYLLSASGVNTGRALRDLDALTGIAQPLYENELDSIHGVKRDLARKHRDDFQEMIDSHIRGAHDDFNKMIDEELHGVDWTSHRQRIYEHFGLRRPTEDGTPETGSFGRSRKARTLGISSNGKSFGLAGLSKSVIGTPGLANGRQSQFADVADRMPANETFRTAPEDRVSRVRQEKYADKVKDLNIARLQERAYPVFEQFSQIESDQPSENTAMLLNAFNALIKITGEATSEESIVVKERQYAKGYLDDSAGSQSNVAIRKRILDGSRSFLETLFYAQVDSTVAKNPREANVGGIPTAIAKVKGYVRVRATRRELGPELEKLQEVEGDYCWAIIFYLLRSGLIKDAVTYVEENANAFRHIDRKFMGYLRHYAESAERRLSQRDQTEINNDYSQRAKLAPEDSIDPYRMMCYKIIGRCDLLRRTIDSINSDMMDFLWLQFALAREYNRVDEFAHEAFGLDEVRNTIKDIGERYFGHGSDIPNAPTTFFFMQVLAGMFEKAVADLYAHNYVSAVHFAIALDYYGLLRVSDIKFSDELLSFTTRQQSQLAFGSMIGLYTADFRTANPTAAADYLVLICLNADLPGDLGRGQKEICHQALTELVLETREFASLLGDIRADGQRIKGAIELRLRLIGLEDEQDFLRQITLVAARTADDNGRTTDAALLFHLAEDYDKVYSIVTEATSLALTTELGERPQKLLPLKPRTEGSGQDVSAEVQGSLSLTSVDDPIELARNFRGLYGSKEMYYRQIKPVNRDCCNLLLALADARRALESGNWPATIDYINNASVLPTEAHGNMVAIRNKSNAFNEMPTVAARTIGHVMIWLVVACSNHVQALKRAEFETPAQQDVIRRCVETAKDVMLFAGLIKYKLPGRVWETLARAGQDLNAY